MSMETMPIPPPNMTVERQAFKGASWLAIFRLISQIFSWSLTIIVARLLSPEDFGLKEMATIAVGYALLFNELGIGAAIIQKKKLNDQELSSVFWASLTVSTFLGLVCFGLAYPLSWFFHEPRVVPLSMAVALLFPIGGVQVVPLNLLKKELDFKKVGFVEMIGSFVGATSTLILAYCGKGAWALVGGNILLSICTMSLYFILCKWKPSFRFRFKEAKSYLHFGIIMAIGESLFYAYETCDRFLAGRAWSPKILGYYTFALDLATLPLFKIISLINQVSFPAFSKLQNEPERTRVFYLNVTKINTLIVIPLYVGGFLAADELVRVILDEKWFPIIFIFKWLCLAQIITVLNAINNFVHAAQGRPLWRLYFHAALAILMSISFFFAVKEGLHAILIPWFTTYIVLCVIWILITIKKLGIGLFQYALNLSVPFFACLCMVTIVVTTEFLLLKITAIPLILLIAKCVSGGLSYAAMVVLIDRNIILKTRELFSKSVP